MKPKLFESPYHGDAKHIHCSSPNPFNPTTTISYSIGEDAHVDLRVYDQLGCSMATLVSDRKSGGLFSVNFDASDFPSDVYFYRLTALGQTVTKKMTLVR